MKAELDFAAWGPCNYIQLPFIHPDWKVLDVGPGTHPLPRADVYLDRTDEHLAALSEAGKGTILCDISNGASMIGDHAFDFVWCSHALEHILEVQKAVDTLNRIAKRGMIVVPSVFKDAIFNHEEDGHVWHCLPNSTQGEPPIFVERNVGYINRLKDQLVQKATCFLYRTGTQHDCTAERHLRAWYQEKEPSLDIVHTWDEAHPLRIISIR